MTASAVGAEFDAKEFIEPQKTGQNGHFTPAGCDHHRLTSAHRVNKRNYKVYSNGAFGKNAPFVVPRYVYAILT